MITRRTAAILFMVFVFCAYVRLAPAADLTVEDAVRISLQNNYDIQIARNTARAAGNDIGRGTAGFLPKLDSAGSCRYDSTHKQGGEKTVPGNQNFRTLGSQLSLQWTLFDGFGMFANMRRYRALARQGEQDARNTIETTVVAVMRAYFDLVQQEQLLDVARSTRDTSRARLKREEVRRDLGGASSTDLLNARVNFNSDQAVLLDQELRVSIARKELNMLLARDAEADLAVKKEIPVPPLAMSLAELQQRTLKNSASLKAARHRMLAAAERVKIAGSSFWPRLTINGQYGYTSRKPLEISNMQIGEAGYSTPKTDRSLDASVTLQLSFNIFNGNLDRINYQNARLEAKSSALAHHDIENRIAGLMHELYATFQKRTEKVALEAQNAVTAEQNLQLQQERYATGASDSLDFRDAQVNFSRARSSLITARYQARIALLDIQQLTGQIAIE